MRTTIGRALSAAATLLLLTPLVAWADGLSVWLVPGDGRVWIPGDPGVKSDRPAFGGIIGFKASSSWAVEARGSIAASDDAAQIWDLDAMHGEANLTWFLAEEAAIRPYLTGGVGAISLSAGAGNDTKFAWNAGAGFAIRLSNRMGLRLDWRDISYRTLVPSKGEKESKHSPEIFGGVSLGFGGAPEDGDRDGVPDKLDRCPATRFGSRVDAGGCPIDGDGDGVPDGIDLCEGTPPGAAVDAGGCPSDADGDGVSDGIDRCADSPKGARVDRVGCPSDSDKDGVLDGLDQCEGTPSGCTVNPNGCHADSDQDGVCDGLDKCADTPDNVRVDQNGCPIEVSFKETELLETGMIRLQDVNFDSGKATIKPESFRALDEVGDILTRWPGLRIEIAGHTDSRGGDALNQKLSDARAKSVLNYILNKYPELPAEQFTSKGYGETLPVATNTTVLGMAKNRRVEFRVLNKEALKRQSEQKRLAPKE